MMDLIPPSVNKEYNGDRYNNGSNFSGILYCIEMLYKYLLFQLGILCSILIHTFNS